MPPMPAVVRKLRALDPDEHPTFDDFKAACIADGIEWTERDDRHVPDELARRQP